MALPKPTLRLTDEQIAFYRREGYLVLDAVTTVDEVTRLRAAYDRIFADRAGRETGNQFDLAGPGEQGSEAALPQILGYAQYAPEFAETLMLANAKVIAQQLFGEQASANNGHAIYKPPRTGAPTPWHQDEAYWNPDFDYFSFSMWVPLQEATLENGCMHFVPRSHKLEVLRHQPINNDPRIHGLELHETEHHHLKNIAACPLSPGGATIHDSRTLHHTPPNVSDIPRRAVILGGAAPAKKRATPRRFPWNEIKKPPRLARALAAEARAKADQPPSEL